MNCIICNDHISYGKYCPYCRLKYSWKECIPSGRWNWTFENFVITSENKLAFNIAYSFADGNYNAFIFGNCGNGKTHLLTAAYRRALEKKIRCSFISFPVMAKIKRHEYETRDESLIRTLEYINGDKLLFLDAIFDENINRESIDMLYCLLDNVIANNKQRILMSSNFGLEKIGKISDRISSRILRLCGKENLIINAELDWALK